MQSYKGFNFCFILFLFLSSTALSQVTDNTAWLGFKLHTALNSKTSVALQPILRLDEDLSSYQNSSIDYSIKHKLHKNWSAQVLGRTWFIPDNTIRQFLWLDVAFSHAIKKFKVSSSVRLHYAFDINDRVDGDFLRWKSGLTYSGLGNWQPFVFIEPWLRLDGDTFWQRYRIEPGFKYKFNDAWDVLFLYRWEEWINRAPENKFNMLVLTLSWKIFRSEKN